MSTTTAIRDAALMVAGDSGMSVEVRGPGDVVTHLFADGGSVNAGAAEPDWVIESHVTDDDDLFRGQSALRDGPFELVANHHGAGRSVWINGRGDVLQQYVARDVVAVASGNTTTVWSRTSRDAYLTIRTELVTAWTRVGAARGLTAIHAGLVDTPRHERIAVIGDKGAGKTTACLLLAHLGCQLLSDETVMVGGDGPLTATGIFRRPAVDLQVLCRYGLSLVPSGMEVSSKAIVEVAPPSEESSQHLDLLVFPEYEHASRSRLQEVDAGELAATMGRNLLTPRTASSKSALIYERLLATAAVRYVYSDDDDENLATLARAFGGAA